MLLAGQNSTPHGTAQGMTHGTIHGTAHGTAHSMSGALHCAAQRVWGSTAALTSPRPATCGYTLYSTISKRRSLHMHHARLQTRADFGGCACARTHTHTYLQIARCRRASPALLIGATQFGTQRSSFGIQACHLQMGLTTISMLFKLRVWHAAPLVTKTHAPPAQGTSSSPRV